MKAISFAFRTWLLLGLLGVPACEASHKDSDASEPSGGSRAADAGIDAGPSVDAALQQPDAAQIASDAQFGPWGRCGPSPLEAAVPPEVIDVAEEALRPGGFAAQDIPGYANATKCQRVSLGEPYRYGMPDPGMLSRDQIPDSFVVFFDDYLIAWFCDGSAAGRLEIRRLGGHWSVASHGRNTDWINAVGDVQGNAAPGCMRANVTRPDVGSWVILTDQTEGVVIRKLFAGSMDAHTKEEFVEQLREATGQ